MNSIYSVAVALTSGRKQFEKFNSKDEACDKLRAIRDAIDSQKSIYINKCLVNPSHIVCAYVHEDSGLERFTEGEE